ncbi:hypothetical protein Skr01_15850 [Sphaerisporangium krabiense]|uniref:Putative membrane protein n=1 Tax=Sphaerisporangium krabiense TaxID=763782 RepID=A0A7W8YZC9_9ACTN|nr:SHOCT domain-containing protein [Sphaerisporangium krabiense]MBB5624545.1 putative membrane protein [Sphaerisporangium krabiense]GII61500.1 hypothetical protein Skr01_15850 [Sphaerisporangium krabiense]
MPYAHWGAAPWWPVLPLFWAAFWVTMAVLFLRARGRGWSPRTAPWASGGGARVAPTAAAEKIIAERYARGELGDDEYFQRLAVLRGGFD